MKVTISPIKINTEFKPGDIVQHRNGHVGIVMSLSGITEVNICTLYDSTNDSGLKTKKPKNHTTLAGRWRMSDCKLFEGTITITQ